MVAIGTERGLAYSYYTINRKQRLRITSALQLRQERQIVMPTAGQRERELAIKAINVIHQYRDKDEGEIIKELIASGVESIDAEKALLFVETAFARVVLSDSGARVSDSFTVHTFAFHLGGNNLT